MPGILPADIANGLEQWLAGNNATASRVLSQGYQGKTVIYEQNGMRLVIKMPPTSGLLRFIYAMMLRHEYRAYSMLSGMSGIPRCYGLLHRRFLVLEYIDGETLRKKQPEDRDYFFARMLEIIKELHKRGIAHVDLKKKENILIVNGSEPVFVDFGVAARRKNGFRIVNDYIFRVAKHFDYNAWIKHKYNRQYESVSDEDRQYLKRTIIERISRIIKQFYRKLFG